MTRDFRERDLIVSDDVDEYDGTTAVVRSEHLDASEIEFMRWRAERWMKVKHLWPVLVHSPWFVLRHGHEMLAHTFRGVSWRSLLGLEDRARRLRAIQGHPADGKALSLDHDVASAFRRTWIVRLKPDTRKCGNDANVVRSLLTVVCPYPRRWRRDVCPGAAPPALRANRLRRTRRDLAACSRRGCRTSAPIPSKSRRNRRARSCSSTRASTSRTASITPRPGRAFAEAARLDPTCAMAYWGQALVLGPNINAAMAPEDEPKALALVQKAQSLARGVTARERAYIDALATALHRQGRRSGRPPTARSPRRCARSAKKYPRDLDAATIFAESLMDLRPWNYWTRDGVPHEGTEEAIATLERVLAANPKHPGALHYWIHLWEPTKTPERAEKEADRLLPLMPGAGHIVHMPAHIYLRVGRYADVVSVNQLAVAADEDYIAQCRAQGLYPLGYYPHNIHFVWIGATMSGQSRLAVEAARKTAAVGGARDSRAAPVRSGLPGRAVLRARAIRPVGRDPRRAEAGSRLALHPRDLALRARVGVCRDRSGRQGACRSARRSRPSRRTRHWRKCRRSRSTRLTRLSRSLSKC